MMEPLMKLASIASVSGDERAFVEQIIREIADFADYRVDALGNLLVHKKGLQKPNKVLLLSTPMDESGLIVTEITDEGYLKVTPVGQAVSRLYFGKRILFGETVGVIGGNPVHLIGKKERTETPKFDDLFVDIGAVSKEDALHYVKLGSRGVLQSDCELFGENLVSGRALVRAVGCQILIDLIHSELPYDMDFAFTVQSQVGHHGAVTAAYAVDPDCALSFESIEVCDKSGCELGKGPAVPFMDKGILYDGHLYEILQKTAEEQGISIQTPLSVQAKNEAAAMHTVRNGIATLSLQIPCRYVGSAREVASLTDIEQAKKLIGSFASIVAHD